MTRNIYIKSLIAFFLALTIGSCAIDDDPAIIKEIDNNNYIQFEKEGKIDYPSGSDLKITMQKASDTKSKVSYVVAKKEADGSVTTVDENDVVFLSGETEKIINIATPLLDTFTITLSNAAGLNHPEIKVGDRSSLELLSLPVPSQDNVLVVMANSDNSPELWLGLSEFSSDGSIWVNDYVGSLNDGSYPRIASIPLNGAGAFGAIPNSSSIAPNTLAINLYPREELSGTVTYEIYVVMPDGTSQSFNGEIPGTSSVDNAAVKVTCIEDPNNSAQKKYSFESF